MGDAHQTAEMGVRHLGFAGRFWFGGGPDPPFFTPSLGWIHIFSRRAGASADHHVGQAALALGIEWFDDGGQWRSRQEGFHARQSRPVAARQLTSVRVRVLYALTDSHELREWPGSSDVILMAEILRL